MGGGDASSSSTSSEGEEAKSKGEGKVVKKKAAPASSKTASAKKAPPAAKPKAKPLPASSSSGEWRAWCSTPVINQDIMELEGGEVPPRLIAELDEGTACVGAEVGWSLLMSWPRWEQREQW